MLGWASPSVGFLGLGAARAAKLVAPVGSALSGLGLLVPGDRGCWLGAAEIWVCFRSKYLVLLSCSVNRR